MSFNMNSIYDLIDNKSTDSSFGISTRELSDYVDKTAQNVVKCLAAAGLKLSAAESCTGGMLSQYITGVSGASNVFECGIVSYSERIKSEMLGIPPQLIEQCGVVSREVAEAMSVGSRLVSGSDIGVGITGIAGPGGGTKDQPVGTIFVSVSRMNKIITRDLALHRFQGLGRNENRLIAVAYALETVIRIIKER